MRKTDPFTVLCRSACLPLLLMAGILSCGNDYNPFADHSNARAIILESSIGDNDTVEIFRRESLTVAASARDLVDSIVITAGANRLLDTITLTPATDNLVSVPYFVSFSDTGHQTVRVSTWRRQAAPLVEEISVYAVSPLAIQPVAGALADSVTLSATGVRDEDVLYHWDLGRGSRISSKSPEARMVVQDIARENIGFYWVSDPYGINESPRVAFPLAFIDTIPPRIVCTNAEYDGARTIRTSQDPFPFRVMILDRGQAEPFISTINGEPFYQESPPHYLSILGGLDTLEGGSMRVVVRAIDNPRDMNVAVAEFEIVYDSLSQPLRDADIRILVPASDTMHTAMNRRYMMGTVENLWQDSFSVVVQLNGKPVGEPIRVGGVEDRYWGRELLLHDSISQVAAILHSAGGESVDTTSTVFILDPAVNDTAPPVIVEAKAGGKRGRFITVEEDTTELRIIAFDEQSGLERLLVNSRHYPPSAEKGGYVWRVPVVLEHGVELSLAIEARDSIGYRADTVLTVVQNRSPRIIPHETVPVLLASGTVYRDTLEAVDQDGDPLWFNLAGGPAGLAVSEEGVVVWQPSAGQTGSYLVQVSVEDGRSAAGYEWTVRVVDSAALRNAVRFATGKQAIPSWLLAGRDSLMIDLYLVDGSGAPPFTFSAVRERAGAVIDMPMNGETLLWKPSAADTGVHRISVMVQDDLRHRDTLFFPLTVVPANRPFTLELNTDLPLTDSGVVDLSTRIQPESLTVRIDDPDPLIAERFSVQVTYAGVRTQRSLGGERTVLIGIDPSLARAPRDTLRVMVRDRGLHADSLIIPLLFGAPPNAPVLLSPADGGVVGQAGALLQWQGSDPDGNALRYYLSIDTSPLLTDSIPLGTDTAYRVTSLMPSKTYYWRVCATDGRFSTVSKTNSFVVSDNFRKVRLDLSGLGSGSAETIERYPLLVHLDSSDIPFDRADSATAWFSRTDGSPLPFEIEQWDPSGGDVWAWVLLDSIGAAAAYEEILMQWGPAQSSIQSGGSAVFGATHTAVWHMKEDVSPSYDDTSTDATGNGYGVRMELNSGYSKRKPGVAAHGTLLDGADDVLRVVDVTLPEKYCISGWFNLASDFTETSSASRRILGCHMSDTSGVWIELVGTSDLQSLYPDQTVSAGCLVVNAQIGTGKRRITWTTQKRWEAGVWYHFAATPDTATPAASFRILINGAEHTTYGTRSFGPWPHIAPPNRLSIGAGNKSPNENSEFGGILDELRISNHPLTARRIRLDYLTQRPDSSILAIR
jgi:hypothetical protein